jgi:phenylacetate-CoA ligase
MNRTLAKILFYTIETLRGEHVFTYLRELERNQYLPKEEIAHLQKRKLRKLLNHIMSYNKYYRNKYEGYDIQREFVKLPIVTKQELRDNYANILSQSIHSKCDLVETSGSTGVPLKFYRDRVAFGYTLASMYRAHRWWGLDVGDREAMLWGVPVNSWARLKAKTRDLLLNRFREKEYNISPATLYEFYLKVKAKRPDFLFGYSSMVYEFALFLKEKKLSLDELALKAAICTAEMLDDDKRKLIEQVLQCKTVSEYGATEAGIISYQCKKGCNHISDDCVYVEIVDDNNMPLPDGESGRVLVTVLNNFSSPIIRYDLGDISSRTVTECDCGINLSTLGKVEGRSTDVVIAPNGKVYHSIIFYYIMKELTEKIGGINKYKIHQRRIDELDIYIVKGEGFREHAEEFIREQIREKFGEAMRVKFVYNNFIDRKTSGKFRDFETDLDSASLLADKYGHSHHDI